MPIIRPSAAFLVLAFLAPDVGAGPLREARLLLDGRVRPGAWTAALAEVESGESLLRGALVAAAGPAEYRLDVALQPGFRGTIAWPVFQSAAAGGTRLFWVREGAAADTPVEPILHEIPAGDLLIGVDPARAAAARLSLPLRETVAGGRTVHWVSLAWGDVGAVLSLLDSLDGIVCGEPELGTHPAFDAQIGAWLGRGGRLARDPEEIRKAVRDGWAPAPRPAAADAVPARDVLPRSGVPPSRLARARLALGALIVLGAVSVVLAGWGAFSRGATATAAAAASAAAIGLVLVLVPAGGASLRVAAVRTLLFPEWAPGRRIAVEAVEGLAALERPGGGEAVFRFPARTRVAVADGRTAADPAAVTVRPGDGGCEVRDRLAPGARRFLSFSRNSPAGETFHPRVVRLDGKPVRVDYETGFQEPLREAVLVDGRAVYRLGDIFPQPVSGEREVESPLSWEDYLRRVGPPGDGGRALRAWWGARRGAGAWVLAVPSGAPPVAAEGGAGADVEWSAVLLAVPVAE